MVFRDGFRITTGIVSGAFGVHLDEERDHPGSVVTHLETGMSVTGLQPLQSRLPRPQADQGELPAADRVDVAFHEQGRRDPQITERIVGDHHSAHRSSSV